MKTMVHAIAMASPFSDQPSSALLCSSCLSASPHLLAPTFTTPNNPCNAMDSKEYNRIKMFTSTSNKKEEEKIGLNGILTTISRAFGI